MNLKTATMGNITFNLNAIVDDSTEYDATGKPIDGFSYEQLKTKYLQKVMKTLKPKLQNLLSKGIIYEKSIPTRLVCNR